MSIPVVSRVAGLVGSVANLLKPQPLPPFFVQPADTPIVRSNAIVVAHHPRLRAIGHSVLEEGGNAFDAFVAVTAAQNVMAEGACSLAGPLGVLTYTASDGHLGYLDADFNDPLDPAWRWDAKMPKDGRTVLVPGAPAGLEALAKRYGTRSLSELLQPAIELAEEGLPVSRLLATFIKWRSSILKRSDYGRDTFFDEGGKPLQIGQTLRQPEVASFLSNLAAEGSQYVYSGRWGRSFLDFVGQRNGVLSRADLRHYRVHWEQPWTAAYRGHRLYSSSGRSYGGVWGLLALKTLEHGSLADMGHYSEDAAALELLVLIARRVWSEEWILDPHALDDRELVESRLTERYTDQLWHEVANDLRGQVVTAAQAHSYHVVVADGAGNVASGTTTIESDPWGEGMFVEGLPLSTAGAIPWSTAPGERRLSPFALHLAFQDDRLSFAAGGISNSVVEASFQFLVNLIDYGLPVGEAATMPRFGTFPSKRKLDMSKNWLDPRIDASIVTELKGRLRFEQRGVVDTGSGVVLAAAPDGTLAGMPVPIPYIADPFAEASDG